METEKSVIFTSTNYFVKHQLSQQQVSTNEDTTVHLYYFHHHFFQTHRHIPLNQMKSELHKILVFNFQKKLYLKVKQFLHL